MPRTLRSLRWPTEVGPADISVDDTNMHDGAVVWIHRSMYDGTATQRASVPGASRTKDRGLVEKACRDGVPLCGNDNIHNRQW